MLKEAFGLLEQVLTLTETTQANSAEIKAIRHELDTLTSAVERIAYELHRLRENEIHEREKMALRLENELLRFERRLPRPRPDDVE
jgi:predicted RNase H-like nuclease (RuvC/YqgF family)